MGNFGAYDGIYIIEGIWNASFVEKSISICFKAKLRPCKEVTVVEYTTKGNACKNLTLCYYNRYLRDRGIITEQEYLRMVQAINLKYPLPNSLR